MKSQHLLRQDATRIWKAALRAVDPESAIRRIVKRDGSLLRIDGASFDLKKTRKLWVLGAGKAAAPMGRAVEKILGRYLAGGILATKYGHSLPLKTLDVVEAGHPLPDANSLASRGADYFSDKKQYPAGRSRSLPSFGRRFFFARVPC